MMIDVGVIDGGPIVANYKTTANVQSSFSGITDPDFPPDNELAVGPTNAVMAEGEAVEWTNLSGGSPTRQSAYNFFPPLGGASTWTGSLKDISCSYDSINHRFIVVAENLVPHSSGDTSNIEIAVSKDSNPNDGWYFGSISSSLTINGTATASDEPTVSVDGSNIYIAMPQYNAAGGGWQGSACWVIGDTAGSGGGIYNGGTPTIVGTTTTSPNQGIYRVVSGDNGKAYYACVFSPGSQTDIALVTYDAATNTYSPASSISLGNIDQGDGGTFFTAQQQGTSILLDANDGRLANLAYANGFLYGVSEMKPIGSSVAEVHWFKIDVSNPNNPVLVAQGNISGAAIGSNVATFNGSIAVDSIGDVVINFTASGPNMYPADYYVHQGFTDPSNTFSAPVLYQASTSFFNSGDGSATQRWGANSSAMADPNNPRRLLAVERIRRQWLVANHGRAGRYSELLSRSAPVPTRRSAETLHRS